jgi:hypothetical protein
MLICSCIYILGSSQYVEFYAYGLKDTSLSEYSFSSFKMMQTWPYAMWLYLGLENILLAGSQVTSKHVHIHNTPQYTSQRPTHCMLFLSLSLFSVHFSSVILPSIANENTFFCTMISAFPLYFLPFLSFASLHRCFD